ncbi:MAG: hypothetical protein AVO34_02380 [Firmicutes bacterium ML8_F2]|nr:MAG: hypothetical protein AVO34_02380 [Firmicutes bacterium ML8_F2]
MIYDIIIIGGGPAALSAGIYAARKKLNLLLLVKEWGGQMNEAARIENYLGFNSISGAELVHKFITHLKKFDLEIKENQEIKEVKKAGLEFEVISVNGDKHQGKSLIIASGKGPKKLGVPGEEEFIGKGVSFCATCDAPLFANKKVAVIGGGNAAAEAALETSEYASEIYLLALNPKLRIDKVEQEKIKAASNIKILFNVQVEKIQGNKFVTGLVYRDKISQEEKKMSVEGVYIEIGSVPISNFVKSVVELNKEGEIKTDFRNMTSCPGIFAAGDVTDVFHKQIIIAAGEGAKAAISASEYLS